MSLQKKKFNCPAEMTVHLIDGKWKAILLYNLRKSPQRFGELRRLSPGISRASLTQNLKELEETGLIRRAVLGKDPLSGVEYSLTTRGETLRPVLNALIRWGLQHQKEYVVGPYGMDPRR